MLAIYFQLSDYLDNNQKNVSPCDRLDAPFTAKIEGL